MKVENYVSGDIIEFNSVCSITDDGKYLDKTTHDRAGAYFRKGHMTSQEIDSYLNDCKEYEELVFIILNKCARYAKDMTVFVHRVLDDVIEKEEEISVKLFKKTRELLTLEEYKEVIATLDNVIPWITGASTTMSAEDRKSFSGTHRTVIARYINNCKLAILLPNHHVFKQP